MAHLSKSLMYGRIRLVLLDAKGKQYRAKAEEGNRGWFGYGQSRERPHPPLTSFLSYTIQMDSI